MQDPTTFSDVGTWVGAIGTCVAAVASIFAAYFFYKNLVWLQHSQKSKEFSDCAIDALESAYTTLMGTDSDKAPQNIASNWTSSARQISNFKALKSQIASHEYIVKCTQAEEFYRNRFQRALCLIPAINSDYFSKGIYQSGAKDEDPEPINLNPKSLAVVFNFAFKGPSDDSLDKESVQALLGSSTAIKYNIALKNYLVKLGELPKA